MEGRWTILWSSNAVISDRSSDATMRWLVALAPNTVMLQSTVRYVHYVPTSYIVKRRKWQSGSHGWEARGRRHASRKWKIEGLSGTRNDNSREETASTPIILEP